MTDRPSSQTHTVVRGRHEWYCTAKNPRCGFVAPLGDMGAVFSHTTGSQADLRRERPVPGVVTGPMLADEGA